MLKRHLKEVIFVGLPGPTHNYGGLSADNVASSLNRGSISNPKQAAYQALDLVRLLKSLGITAGILPPQLRAHMATLREKYAGSDEDVLKAVARENPALLEKLYSSSAMWTANAATVTASADSEDSKLHLTTANLYTNLHRRIEAADTHRVLAAAFVSVPDAHVHAPLAPDLRDEGAANHMRLAPNHSAAGLNIYVYGADGSATDPKSARQALAASQEIVKDHQVAAGQALFIKQNPAVINEGVFHNDVIAVANEYVLLAHEEAYENGAADMEKIVAAYEKLHGEKPVVIVTKSSELTVAEAVRTYFFNSQIVTKPDGKMAIIAPVEVKNLYGGKAAALMEKICVDSANPIDEIHYADLRQSMNNGGGPACLRLRVPMNDAQISAMQKSVNMLADEKLLDGIAQIIESEYPDQLSAKDLADPKLYRCSKKVTKRLGELMRLPLI